MADRGPSWCGRAARPEAEHAAQPPAQARNQARCLLVAEASIHPTGTEIGERAPPPSLEVTENRAVDEVGAFLDAQKPEAAGSRRLVFESAAIVGDCQLELSCLLRVSETQAASGVRVHRHVSQRLLHRAIQTQGDVIRARR